ncbi:hypothetical protein BJY16_004854 [Actinoplanes octamycinicus]|uniref:Uncharacterized protein n=1 Tax=Actinoplanes octamycinicus TaxID=135948 RepID=A0A7W7GZV8_9ACTN|nr:hypothetical protein [Actinoplanes octamycinicus]MBB4741395.1 hypothetical protein [Actinoplanes octamycinicus]GIE62806.1 hypothetical protein Aoc01nite_82080 [Actinoplanes octamycinicus]
MSQGPQYPSWDEPQPAMPAAPWNPPRPARASAPVWEHPAPTAVPVWEHPAPTAVPVWEHPAPPAAPVWNDPAPAPPRWDPQPVVQPGYYGGPQPGYQPAAGSAIAITMRYAPIAFLLGVFTPVLTIDNQPIQAGWRRRIVVPVSPGPHYLHAHVPYLIPRRIGKADLPVSVAPGETISLEYRAPVIVFLRGAFGGPPQKYPGLVAAVLLSLVLLVLALGSGIAAAQNRALPLGPPARPATPPTFTAPAFPVDPTGPAVPTFPGAGGDKNGAKPELRPDAETRTVVGATFGAGDQTFTMAFGGWPFAFRAPDTWGCRAARTDLPEAQAWLCVDERDRTGGERTGVVLRACPGTCAAADKARLVTQWLGDAPGIRKAGGNTRFRQLATNLNGKYELKLSHFFTDPASGRKFQVGVQAEALTAKKAVVQKVVNEILSQSSF